MRSVSLLIDADIYREDNGRPTDFGARSGGEGEISALRIGTCCFPRMVNEVTMGPRPASAVSTANVETCHPLLSCNPTIRRSPDTRQALLTTGASTWAFPPSASAWILQHQPHLAGSAQHCGTDLPQCLGPSEPPLPRTPQSLAQPILSASSAASDTCQAAAIIGAGIA